MEEQRWLDLMQTLSMENHTETYNALYKAYSEKHRFYHTRTHIQDCLNKLDKVKHLANKPGEVELALWFHDAIYKPLATNNEEKSAEWAYRFIVDNSGKVELAKNVYSLIMATVHTVTTTENDIALLVDIDLSILGSTDDVFQTFEHQIRQEYKSVPLFIYRRKRKSILSSFLARERIYQHTYFYDRYEASARQNLEKTINTL